MKRLFPALLLLAELSAYGSTAARQADLNFVANQLPHLHANFFYQLDPTVYQNAANQLGADLPNLPDAEFYDRLAALVAMAGDPHTTIYLYGSAAATAGFQQFPLIFRWLDDGVFVTGAAPQYTRALGAKLVKVGSTPIDQAVAQVAALIPHTNDQWLHYMAQTYLRGQQILQGLHLAPVSATTPLTFRSLAGEEFTLDVAAGTGTLSALPDPNGGTSPMYLQKTNQNYWFVYSAANRLLYFKYNVCGDAPGNPFASFANNLLATIDSNPVDTLVFDLRGNTGGNSSIWNPLLNGLEQRLPTLLLNPRFRVYGAIDKGTFSSGSLDAMIMKQPAPPEVSALFPGVDFTKLVQMIGEPTGGATGGYGNVVPFSLPGSGLAGQYSTQYISTPSFITTPGPTFAPDIAIGVRSTDYFARYDPVMGAILARTDSLPAPGSGNAIVVNGASFRSDHGLAPGSFASVFGSYSQVPDQVLVDGTPGKIVAATVSQVNFLVPAVPLGNATVSVRTAGTELASGQATITAAGPGIFVLGADPSQPGAVENQDYSVNTADNPAAVGSIVMIYATGAGSPDASGNVPASVFFGDVPAEVLASVPLTQYPGLWQINTRVPAGVAGQVPVFVITQNLASNAVTVTVR